MEVQLSKEVLDRLTAEDHESIKDILKKSFSDRNAGLDFDHLVLKQEDQPVIKQEQRATTFRRGAGDCAACDAGYAIAVAACAMLGPFGATACIAVATAARASCREKNC